MLTRILWPYVWTALGWRIALENRRASSHTPLGRSAAVLPVKVKVIVSHTTTTTTRLTCLPSRISDSPVCVCCLSGCLCCMYVFVILWFLSATTFGPVAICVSCYELYTVYPHIPVPFLPHSSLSLLCEQQFSASPTCQPHLSAVGISVHLHVNLTCQP